MSDTSKQSGEQPMGVGSQSELDTDLDAGAQETNEGEGSRTAARRYNKATEAYARSGQVEPAAREAKEALDGAEGEELREAEERAKQSLPDWGGHRH